MQVHDSQLSLGACGPLVERLHDALTRLGQRTDQRGRFELSAPAGAARASRRIAAAAFARYASEDVELGGVPNRTGEPRPAVTR
jgi:hypothetical protein